MKKKVLSFLFAVVLTAMLLPLNKSYAGNTELPQVANWRALATAMNGGSSTGVADVFTVEDKDNTRTITLLADIRGTYGKLGDEAELYDIGDKLSVSNKEMKIVLDLNGHILNRGLIADTDDKRYNMGNEISTAIYVTNEAKLTIVDSNPTAEHEGYISESGRWHPGEIPSGMKGVSMTLKGGIIRGGTGYSVTCSGGGIYIINGGTVEMTGGNIAGNGADYGGGVYVNNGSFVMTKGTIVGNSAENGAGVYAWTNGKFTMASDAVVAQNTASESGGGVYLYKGSIEVADGIIAQNYAKGYGGGVFANDSKLISVSGKTVIANNETAGMKESNVHLCDNKPKVKVLSLSDGAQIGVTTYCDNTTDWQNGTVVSQFFLNEDGSTTGLTQSNMPCFFMTNSGKANTDIVYDIEYADSTYKLVKRVSGCGITLTNDGNGSAVAKVNDEAVTKAGEGDTVTLVATPAKGYEFDKWEVISGGVTVTDDAFTMPATDVSIKACFKLAPTITATAAPNPVNEGEKFVIKGIVVRGTDPVSKAEVEVSIHKKAYIVLTGADGSFDVQVSALAAGTYEASATYGSYKATTIVTVKKPHVHEFTGDYEEYDTENHKWAKKCACGEYDTEHALTGVKIPVAETGHVYNGEFIFGASDWADLMSFCEMTDFYAGNAGTYQGTFILHDKYIWSDGTMEPKKVDWSIAPLVLKEATAKDAEYTGAKLTPEISFPSKGLVLGKDYKVSEWSGELVEPGTYTATVTFVGNYTGSVKVTFTILPCSHDFEEVAGLVAAEEVAGYLKSYKCKKCGKYFVDNEGKTIIGDEAAYTAWKAEGGEGYLALLPKKQPTFTIEEKELKANSYTLRMDFKAVEEKSAMKVTWSKVKDADGYFVYAGMCGKSLSPIEPIRVEGAKKTSITLKSIGAKKYDKKEDYKVYVVAYKTVDGEDFTIAKTVTGHVAGSKMKYTNAKAITVKSKVSVKKGKAVSLNAKVTKVDTKKSFLSAKHAPKLRYEASNDKIKVDANGKVKGVKKGTAYVYIYAQNGMCKKVKVTVK